MNKIAIYPGTFDPITNGHLDIIERAARIFKKVYVAVAKSPNKSTYFSVEDRVRFIKEASKAMKNVNVEAFDGLAVNYVHKKKSHVLIRGLRMISDFEYEFQMALTNRKLAGDVETLFMMPNEEYSYLSSKLVKEIAPLGARISGFVPKCVEKELRRKVI